MWAWISSLMRWSMSSESVGSVPAIPPADSLPEYQRLTRRIEELGIARLKAEQDLAVVRQQLQDSGNGVASATLARGMVEADTLPDLNESGQDRLQAEAERLRAAIGINQRAERIAWSDRDAAVVTASAEALAPVLAWQKR